MRSRISALLLCLVLVTSGASAAGISVKEDRGPGKAGLVEVVWTFVQDLVGMEIDPWGEPASTNGSPEGADNSDVGMQIDPWGDEGDTARPFGPAGDELGPQIDPWG